MLVESYLDLGSIKIQPDFRYVLIHLSTQPPSSLPTYMPTYNKKLLQGHRAQKKQASQFLLEAVVVFWHVVYDRLEGSECHPPLLRMHVEEARYCLAPCISQQSS